jgi:hypothetical protein
MNQTAVWKRKTGVNEYNEQSFAADETIYCRIEYKGRMVRDSQKQQIMSEISVYTVSAVKPDDVIVIDSVEYPVLTVANQADLDGDILFYEVRL